MSRIGKKPIILPPGMTAKIMGNELAVKGVKGELIQKIHPKVKVEISDNKIQLNVADQENNKEKALWGLFGSIIKNMVKGASEGFEKKLEVIGVGFKVSLQGNNKLILNVGFSHPVEFVLPAGISASVEKNVITLNGIDKQLLGETAAQLRRIKKPEPYKGKGIKYIDEVIKKKLGKAAVKSAG